MVSKGNVIDSKRLLNKIETMMFICKCLPASKFDIYQRLKDADKFFERDEKSVKSRVTIDARLKELIDYGIVTEGRCPTCYHKVFEIIPWQKITNLTEDGSLHEEPVFILIDGQIDEFLFNAVLMDKIQWRIKEKQPLKKAQVTKKRMTVTCHFQKDYLKKKQVGNKNES